MHSKNTRLIAVVTKNVQNKDGSNLVVLRSSGCRNVANAGAEDRVSDAAVAEVDSNHLAAYDGEGCLSLVDGWLCRDIREVFLRVRSTSCGLPDE